MGLSTSKLKHNKKSKRKNTVVSVHALLVHKNKSNDYFFRNGKFLVKVNRNKLLEKSIYFQIISNKRNKNPNSEHYEIMVPFKDQIFKNVMQYISDGSMKLDSKTQFEAYHLAVYLQVESLQQFCLDRFTFALSRSNVESQLDQLENHCLLNKKFKERALMF